MQNIKQAIIVRKDLKLSKSRVASLAAKASVKFIIENNEASRRDELYVKLSNEEADWLRSSSPIVLTIDSQSALDDIAFQAELKGITVHSIFSSDDPKAEERTILCVALGPNEESLINQLTNNLKPL